ncbi:hypothetical protein GIB67_033467 [Kingdonia uniflora]|uniref:Cytochrome P450 n=1 Tax=Kingdonia uniflora TaxID=39325 RepID=A0A7J7MDC7_9MAGN|nr:hypothetical protein GIB67_033467 [Kingdonia uniflora]
MHHSLSSLEAKMELFSILTSSSFEFQMLILAGMLISLGSLYVLGYLNLNMNPGKKLPPGSSFIFDFIGFTTAMQKGKSAEWIASHFRKYGPVFRSRVMASQVAILTGQLGNKFLLTANDSIVSDNFKSIETIFGRRSLSQVEGSRHKLLKGALMNMLKPEKLQKFIGEMESIVKRVLLQELEGKDMVNLVTVSRRVIFAITCTMLLGLPEGGMDENILHLEDLKATSRGLMAIPFNIPATAFGKACKARAKISKVLYNLVKKRKTETEDEKMGSHKHDMITSFLNVRDEEGKSLMDEEIVDNLMTLLLASNDSTSSLLSLFLQRLGDDNNVYNKVFEEQMEIAKLREGSMDGKLIWNKTQSMKYSWRVAQEIMRLTPPSTGGTRISTKDIKFGGYDIPKGWRLLWVTSPTHMDPDIFQEPEKFDPSRFESSSKSIAKFTYLPFGAGQRICPGIEFARIEVLLVIHHLVTNYRWTPMIHDEPVATDPTTPFPAMGLPVKLLQMVDPESPERGAGSGAGTRAP